jgi:hypothetical protein
MHALMTGTSECRDTTLPDVSNFSHHSQSVQHLTTDRTTGRPELDPPHRQRIFYFACVQTSSEAHLASFPMGTGSPSPGVKARPGRGPDHSPPSTAELKNGLQLYCLFPYRLHGGNGTAFYCTCETSGYHGRQYEYGSLLGDCVVESCAG